MPFGSPFRLTVEMGPNGTVKVSREGGHVKAGRLTTDYLRIRT
jgi:hypothetical protein